MFATFSKHRSHANPNNYSICKVVKSVQLPMTQEHLRVILKATLVHHFFFEILLASHGGAKKLIKVADLPRERTHK